MERQRLIDRIQQRIPEMQRVMSYGGGAGLSLAVLHQGELICTRHLGYRDIEARLPPDDDTRYNLNSLTKAFVGALMGIEVERGTLNWDTRVKDVLPDFASRDKVVEERATITDLMSHRMGITGLDSRWLGDQNQIINARGKILKIFSDLDSPSSFRDSWTYCNAGYEVACLVLEKMNNKPLHELLHERLFKPLDMPRTSTCWNYPLDDGNMAKSYAVLEDNSLVEIQRPLLGRHTFGEAAGGVKSTMRDMIKWAQAWLVALDYSEASCDGPSGDRLEVLKQTDWLTSHHAQLTKPTRREQGYGIGWCRAQLPGALALSADNPFLNPPVAGRGAKSQPVIYHHGCMPGSTTALYMLPESKSAVLAFHNTQSKCDVPALIVQMLVETIIDTPEPYDYVRFAKTEASLTNGYMEKLHDQLDAHRTMGTRPSFPLGAYVGTYWTTVRDFGITVCEGDGQLQFFMQKGEKEQQPFKLVHYEYDSFSWWMPYDELSRRARLATDFGWQYYLLKFYKEEGSNRIAGLTWAWDNYLPDRPGVFVRDE